MIKCGGSKSCAIECDGKLAILRVNFTHKIQYQNNDGDAERFVSCICERQILLNAKMHGKWQVRACMCAESGP